VDEHVTHARVPVHDPAQAPHLVPVVAGRRPGRVDPEDREVQSRHRPPQGIERRVVAERPVAVPEERRHGEVEPAHPEPAHLVLEGAELLVPEGERLVHLGQPDEAVRGAPHRLREVLGEIAVDVVVLEHGHPDPRVVHLDDHRLGRRREVVHVRGQELDVVALPAMLPLEAAEPTRPEADVPRPARLRGVVSR
jgi:hypothetical protein